MGALDSRGLDDGEHDLALSVLFRAGSEQLVRRSLKLIERPLFPDRGFAALLFDMDGTILSSIAAAERIWADWAQDSARAGRPKGKLPGHPRSNAVRQK